MTAEAPPSRLQIAQRLTVHLGHRDFDQFIDLLSHDVEYRVEGNHVLAGTFRGRDEVITHVRDLVDRTDSTFDAVKWEDWLVGDHNVAALVRVHAQRRGAIYASRLVVLLGFDPADKVSEITIFFEDANGADRFFSW